MRAHLGRRKRPSRPGLRDCQSVPALCAGFVNGASRGRLFIEQLFALNGPADENRDQHYWDCDDGPPSFCWTCNNKKGLWTKNTLLCQTRRLSGGEWDAIIRKIIRKLHHAILTGNKKKSALKLKLCFSRQQRCTKRPTCLISLWNVFVDCGLWALWARDQPLLNGTARATAGSTKVLRERTPRAMVCPAIDVGEWARALGIVRWRET